jgi:3-methyl-2-oxobutanoate hydroxymethyltransferase
MPKTTVNDFLKMKADGKKIAMLTAYDFPFAQMLDEAGIDAILVGDSLGVVVQGLENTLPVTMEEMIYHTRMVARASRNALIIGDMPFMSYQTSLEETIRNAGRFLKDGGAAAIKIEGGAEIADRIKALTRSDIPVMAHIGLTPQSIHRMGGYKVQGKTKSAAKRLMDEARVVEDAGAFSLVLEGIPMNLAKEITKALSIPTIGIGAGPYCDGQVLVLHDLLGMFDRFVPKFIKRYAALKQDAVGAVRQYIQEVQEGIFPSEDQSFK